MRRCVCTFVAMTLGCFASANSGQISSTAEPVVWNFVAVGEVMTELVRRYCPTSLDELIKISDYIIEHNQVASVDELINVCVEPKEVAQKLFVDGRSKREIDKNVGCYGAAVNDDGCAFVIKLLQQQQNKYNKNNIVLETPGTYVIKVDNNVYRIYDVVPGESTDIFVLEADVNGNLVNTGKLGIQTYANDTFLNITSGDLTRGVYGNSYIFTDVDLTEKIYSEFDSWDRGTPLYSAATAVAGRGGNRYDIKERDYVQQHRITQDSATNPWLRAQTNIDAHTNGFVFQGKIVTAEWLGHYIIGMAQGESAFSVEWSDAVLNRQQKKDNKGGSGQSADGEGTRHTAARRAGMQYQDLITKFSATVVTKQMAADMALELLRGQGVCGTRNVICQGYRLDESINDVVECRCEGDAVVTYPMEFKIITE